MATLREIKHRIKGVKNTQQITKAMKMVAAARLRRAQDNIINARPYSRKIAQLLHDLTKYEKEIDNPLLQERTELKNIAFVVVTSDRGLCGSFNMQVQRQVEDIIAEEYSSLNASGNVKLYNVGKKGLDYFKSRPYTIDEGYPGIFSELNFDFAGGLVNSLTQKFLHEELDKVIVVYNSFQSVIQQKVTVRQLLPVDPSEFEESSEDHAEGSVDFIYEPDIISIVNALLPRHLKAQLWTVLLDSYAAEQGARMTAMDMATENAKELIRQLQITFNKERQASITTEILEIVSGADALKDN